MKGYCPKCNTLQDIHPTDEPMEWFMPKGGSMNLPIGSSCWNQVCLHPDKTQPIDSEGKYPICKGSGAKI